MMGSLEVPKSISKARAATSCICSTFPEPKEMGLQSLFVCIYSKVEAGMLFPKAAAETM